MVGRCSACRRTLDLRVARLHVATVTGALLLLDTQLCGGCTCQLLEADMVLDLEIGFLERDGLLAPG